MHTGEQLYGYILCIVNEKAGNHDSSSSPQIFINLFTESTNDLARFYLSHFDGKNKNRLTKFRKIILG